MRRHSMPVTAALWGLDTGLVVTTFRVAAVSWGGLGLAALGVSSPWSGLAYGLGFTVPFLVLATRPALGRASSARDATDPGLESMLRQRANIQRLSAMFLAASAVTLIGASMN